MYYIYYTYDWLRGSYIVDLLNPYFWGGYVRGGRLTSHDFSNFDVQNQSTEKMTKCFDDSKKATSETHPKKDTKNRVVYVF